MVCQPQHRATNGDIHNRHIPWNIKPIIMQTTHNMYKLIKVLKEKIDGDIIKHHINKISFVNNIYLDLLIKC